MECEGGEGIIGEVYGNKRIELWVEFKHNPPRPSIRMYTYTMCVAYVGVCVCSSLACFDKFL